MIKSCSDHLISLQLLYIMNLYFPASVYIEIYYAEISIINYLGMTDDIQISYNRS